jgi:secreted PhoX family phosphatase
MKRRDFMRFSAASFGLALGSPFWRSAYAAPAKPGPGPYGPLASVPDANGLILPSGFSSRVIARTGSIIAGTSHEWHSAPDGGACFALPDGGWVYVSNSEGRLFGGAAAIEFDASANIVGARTILRGTQLNCAGGATPWGTWLSCEEWSGGRVYECHLDGRSAVRRSGLGTFAHEAVAIDPAERRLYLTEDDAHGRFYRFTPSRYPSLADGRLEAAHVAWSDKYHGQVSWVQVSTLLPAAWNPLTRGSTTAFDGGEGCFYDSGVVYFTTKGDNRVWALEVGTGALECIYAAELHPSAPLRGVDNVIVSRSRDLLVAEDGDSMELCLITPARVVAPFLRVVGHEGSELTGIAFNPAGDRLYFSSQRGVRGAGAGVSFEVRGPFRS